MAIGILEVPGASGPEGVRRRLLDFGTGTFRLLHDGGHFLFAADVVADGEFRRTWRCEGDVHIVSNLFPRPEREIEAVLQIKESHRAALEFGAHNAVCRETEADAVECEGFLQIVYAEGD